MRSCNEARSDHSICPKIRQYSGFGTCIWQFELQYSIPGSPNVKKKKAGKGTRFSYDKRRKHRHWLVTIYYHDNEKFARVYINRGKAVQFAERQRKSPVVRTTRILEVD